MSDTKTLYGVWIKGRGWLRNPDRDNTAFASDNEAVARSAATLWGRGARVLPIDTSLDEFERMFLAQQARRWQWPI